MKGALSIGIMMLLFAAGCGGNGDSQVLPTAVSVPPDTDIADAEDTPDEAQESPTSAADTAPAPSGNERFAVEISGDRSISFSGFGQVLLIPEETFGAITFPEHFQLAFNQGLDILVTITLPSTATTATHTLAGPTMPGEFGAELTVLRVPGDFSAGADDFNEEIQGTITLDELGSAAGDNFSGSFEFTAVMIVIDDSGQETRSTVTIQGSFNDMPLMTE